MFGLCSREVLIEEPRCPAVEEKPPGHVFTPTQRIPLVIGPELFAALFFIATRAPISYTFTPA